MKFGKKLEMAIVQFVLAIKALNKCEWTAAQTGAEFIKQAKSRERMSKICIEDIGIAPRTLTNVYLFLVDLYAKESRKEIWDMLGSANLEWILSCSPSVQSDVFSRCMALVNDKKIMRSDELDAIRRKHAPSKVKTRRRAHDVQLYPPRVGDAALLRICLNCIAMIVGMFPSLSIPQEILDRLEEMKTKKEKKKGNQKEKKTKKSG